MLSRILLQKYTRVVSKAFSILFADDTTVLIEESSYDCKTNTNRKFIGIIIDDKLKWTEHIAYVKNKMQKIILIKRH